MKLVEQSLGNLARTIPGATRVFHEYHLDFCCGGRHTLREAAQGKGLDALAIAERLAQLAPQGEAPAPGWAQCSSRELIEYILVRFHERHREQFPELIRLAARVEQVHDDRPDCPHGLARHLEDMQQALACHMRREEQVLFPLILRGMDAAARQPAEVMRLEHEHHGQELAKLEELTDGITPPRGACNTWRALYLGLQALREDLMEHIHLENNVLFERG